MGSPSKCPVIQTPILLFLNICQKLFTAIYGSHFFVNFTLNCVDVLMH